MPRVSSRIVSIPSSRTNSTRQRHLAHGIRASPYAAAASSYKRTVVAGVKAPPSLKTLEQYDKKGRLLVYGPEALEKDGPLAWLAEAWKNFVPRSTPQQILPSLARRHVSISLYRASTELN